MRNDHSIAGTTILQTTLEDADNTQFLLMVLKTNPVVKVGSWTLRRFGVQHHRQSVAMKGKVGFETYLWKETYFSFHGYWLTMVLNTETS